jgi:hypothetical protein
LKKGVDCIGALSWTYRDAVYAAILLFLPAVQRRGTAAERLEDFWRRCLLRALPAHSVADRTKFGGESCALSFDENCVGFLKHYVFDLGFVDIIDSFTEKESQFAKVVLYNVGDVSAFGYKDLDHPVCLGGERSVTNHRSRRWEARFRFSACRSLKNSSPGFLAAWFSGRGRLRPDFRLCAAHGRSWHERRGGMPWMSQRPLEMRSEGFGMIG